MPDVDANGNPRFLTSKYVYDPQNPGKVMQTIAPDGVTTSVNTYDSTTGLLRWSEDAKGVKTYYDNPTDATDGYTPDGLPKKVTDAQGNATTFAYDAVTRELLSTTDQA